MKGLSLAVLGLCFAVSGTANAQLPNKLKEEAEKALKRQLGHEAQEDGKQQAADQSRSRPPARRDADRDYSPGLSFSSLLNGVKMLAKDGKFRFEHIQATFLPDDCEKGCTVLRTADGQELYQIDWKAQTLEKPYSLLEVRDATDLRTGESKSGSWIILDTPGDYVLDFYTPTEHFYTFPFSAAKIGSDDPFGAGECYVLNGAWRDCGYLYYRNAQTDQSLQWKVWLRNDGCEEVPVKIRIEITRDQDGDLVCTSRENTTHKVQPAWMRIEFDMVFPEGKEVPHGTYFKAKDLLEKDGAYTLTMKIDGEAYGTWKFEIEGGKPKYTGSTVRGETDPLIFIEGGRDAFWYCRARE